VKIVMAPSSLRGLVRPLPSGRETLQNLQRRRGDLIEGVDHHGPRRAEALDLAFMGPAAAFHDRPRVREAGPLARRLPPM